MSYCAKAIANYFIGLGTREGTPLSPMKLQKLIYVAHGWHLAIHNTPLIDEQVEAWSYGPVIPTIYHAFKEYGSSSITKLATELQFDDPKASIGNLSFSVITPMVQENDIDTKQLLDKIWEIYSPYTGVQLSNMTHQPGTPWFITKEKYGASLPKGTDIPNQLITDHFQSKAEG